ncbi:hypothetical protein RF55_2565 [Lasius niger]|uniref:Uncharacterized protein n=1 Tax=Lasius niger TaxID=67767 RepID=A0A0J7L3D2_LASNI|nr:hypothetical protein RF55_2565 [Lasius niger]
MCDGAGDPDNRWPADRTTRPAKRGFHTAAIKHGAAASEATASQSASSNRQARRLRTYEDLLGRSTGSTFQQPAAATADFAGFVDGKYSRGVDSEAATAYSFPTACHWYAIFLYLIKI